MYTIIINRIKYKLFVAALTTALIFTLASPMFVSADSGSDSTRPYVTYEATASGGGEAGWSGEADGASLDIVDGIKALRGEVGGYMAASAGISIQRYDKTNGWQDASFISDQKIEAIKIELTGGIANEYNIYYSVKIAPRTGWLGYSKDGAVSGYLDADKYIIGLKIQLVAKSAEDKPSDENSYFYRSAYSKTTYITQKGYSFYDTPYEKGSVKKGSANKYYSLFKKNGVTYVDKKKKIKATKIQTTKKGIYLYVKGKGWIDKKATYTYAVREFDFSCKIKLINSNAKVFTKPDGMEGSVSAGKAKSVVGKTMTASKKLVDCFNRRWIRIENPEGVYLWLNANDMNPNLSYLKGKNKKIEKAIKVGTSKMNKSPYLWGGGRTAKSIADSRFDCSSFAHYCFKKAGKRLGSYGSVSTRTLINYGKKIKFKDMKRGDLLFFKNDKGVLKHVAIYLGDKFFLHDSPSSDSGGVDIDTLRDPYYHNHTSYKGGYYVRRVL